MKIVYVILHYMADKDTIECAESILNATSTSEHDTMVVIVDNGSHNDSYQKIQTVLLGNKQIVILHSPQNLGFAKGNNIGFRYAKEQLDADYIILLNNDTVISQTDFNEILVRKHQEFGYAVLGPDIVTLDGCHQNPVAKTVWTQKKLAIFRAKKTIQYCLAHFAVFDRFLRASGGNLSKDRVSTDVLNTKLHGACLIFSKEYISQFDGLCDKTFLYMEEDILQLYAEHYGFMMMYTPDLQILHKEDVATNIVAAKSIDKKRAIYKNHLDSAKVLADLKRSMARDQ